MAVAASAEREVSSVNSRSPVIDECVKNIHHNRATGPPRLKTRARIHHREPTSLLAHTPQQHQDTLLHSASDGPNHAHLPKAAIPPGPQAPTRNLFTIICEEPCDPTSRRGLPGLGVGRMHTESIVNPTDRLEPWIENELHRLHANRILAKCLQAKGNY